MKHVVTAPRLLAIAAGFLALPAGAQTSTVVDEIVVTGTRRTGVTALSSATPVDVVSDATLQATGSLGLVQALRTAVPSVSFSQVGGIIGARLANSVSLRGLPAGNTLVLVNGKRRTPTAKVSTGNEWSRGSQPVDLNDIPMDAVARVEVLRDGASAQYGSDAIAGVVNIVLRGNERGGYAKATFGQFYEGDGITRAVSSWYTVPLGAKGFVNVSVDLRNNQATDRDNNDIRTYYFPGDPREALINKDFGFYGTPPGRTALASVNGEYELSDVLTAYGFGTASYRKSTNPYMIRPAADNNVRLRFPNGQLAQVNYIFRNTDAVGGLKYDGGNAGKLDLSVEYGRGRQRSNMHNGQNATYGITTPTDFYLGAYHQEQLTAQLDYVKEFPVTYAAKPLTLSAGVGYRREEFSIGAGEVASYANGGVAILDGPNAGRNPTPGAADFAGLQPADAGTFARRVYSAYVGLEQQLTEQFQVGATGRAEHYSDFGDTVTGKLSGRYDFTPQVALRASVSNGFRAPSMGQVGASQTTSLWIQPPVGAQFLGVSAFYPVSNPVARALGAQDLKAEKSTNWSAGVVLRPLPNLSLTLDGYQIGVDDVILPVDNLTGTVMQARLAALGVTNVSAVRFFANQADIRVRGADAVARYNWDWDRVGAFDLTLAANVNRVKIKSIKENPPQLAGSGLVLVGRVSQGYLTQWAPKDKLTASLHYQSGPVDATFSAVRYGKYTNTTANPVNDQVFGAQWVAKVAVSYSFWNDTKITIGADNLFDSYPDKPYTQNRFNGFNNYDLVAPEGGNGGYYYVSLSKRF